MNLGAYKLPIALGVGGVGIIALSAVLGWIVVPNVIENQIKDRIQLINGTDTFDRWSNPKHDVRFTFYVWNVLNADEFDVNEKLPAPILEEVGPFVYIEDRKKIDIVWNEDETRVNFTEPIFYHFSKEHSCPTCREDTKVNIINIAYFSLVTVLHDLLPCSSPNPIFCIPNFISENLIKGEPFIRKDIAVGDLIFYGYDVDNLVKNIDVLPGLLPDEYKDRRFAIYRTKNGTDNGRFEIETGKANHETFGYIRSVDGSPILDEFWYGKYCKMINGTDGSINPPFVKKEDVLPVYNVDLCRSLDLHYHKESVFEDIDALRFVTPIEMLESGEKNKDNYCFCKTWPEEPESCPKSGALYVGSCRSGAPLMMTNPHFLNTDEYYSGEYRHSMRPDFDSHNTYLDIEPNSGLLLSVRKRIQVNVELQGFEHIFKFANISYRLFPLFWVTESADADEGTIDYVKTELLRPINIVNIVKWVALSAGIAIFAVGAFIYYRRIRGGQTV